LFCIRPTRKHDPRFVATCSSGEIKTDNDILVSDTIKEEGVIRRVLNCVTKTHGKIQTVTRVRNNKKKVVIQIKIW
jgi:hypothetical protein